MNELKERNSNILPTKCFIFQYKKAYNIQNCETLSLNSFSHGNSKRKLKQREADCEEACGRKPGP